LDIAKKAIGFGTDADAAVVALGYFQRTIRNLRIRNGPLELPVSVSFVGVGAVKRNKPNELLIRVLGGSLDEKDERVARTDLGHEILGGGRHVQSLGQSPGENLHFDPLPNAKPAT